MPRAAGLALVMVLGVADTALATQVRPVGLAEMVRGSEVIVRARVGMQRVVRDGASRRVLTLTELEVLEAVRGAQDGQVLTVYQVGGTLDGVTVSVPGALGLVPGEEIVFLGVTFGDKVAFFGMGLGKFRVDRSTGSPQVLAELGDVAWVDVRGGRVVPAVGPRYQPMSLEAFVDHLRKLIREVAP